MATGATSSPSGAQDGELVASAGHGRGREQSARGWANWVVAFASLLLTLFLLEVGLRLFSPFSASWSRPDEVVGWSYIPNAFYRFVAPEGCPGWTSAGRINSHGLRDHDYAYAKTGRSFRVLALGDSYTEGFQHPLEFIWPKLLERRLNDRKDGVRYEVINTARSGMGTAHEFLYYRAEGYRYTPNLVVLLVSGNDIEDNSQSLSPSAAYGPHFSLAGEELVLDDSFKLGLTYRLHAVLTPFKQRSQLLSSILRRYRSAQQARIGPGDTAARPPAATRDVARGGAATSPPAPPSPQLAAATAVTGRILRELNHTVRAHGSRLVVFNGGRESWDRNQPNGLLAAIAASDDIPYQDLTARMERHEQSTGELLVGCRQNGGTGHWSRAGHATAAALIYDFLESHDLLPSEGTGAT